MSKHFLLLVALGFAATTATYAQNTFPASGNVGIGTAAPAYMLDVNSTSTRIAANNFGGVVFAEQPYPNQGALLFNTDRTGYTFIIGNRRASDGSILPILTMYDYGNVGIGTTNPGAKLDIGGPTGAQYGTLVLKQSAAGQKGIWLQSYQNNNAISVYHDGTNGIVTTDYTGVGTHGALLLQTTGGNVGIGTTSPTAKVEVSGSVFINCEQSGFVADASGLRRVGFMKYPGLEGAIVHSGSVPFRFGRVSVADVTTATQETFTEEARFDGNGNFGIGTTSPTEKLSVKGKIRAQEVIVETTGWSDFVFADSYKLQSLTEVEQHIKTERHLPGVPSAQEVAEKGVSVGDMQAILLAKIEELTLHVISQEKTLREQAERIKTLEAENRGKGTL